MIFIITNCSRKKHVLVGPFNEDALCSL